jgi:hypothetical protein
MTSGSFRIGLWLGYEGEARNGRPEYVRLLSSIRAAKESGDNAIGHKECTEGRRERGGISETFNLRQARVNRRGGAKEKAP